MVSRFEKNFTDKGYLMNYEKMPLHSSLKNQVLQFSVELQGIEPKIWRRIHVPSDYNFWDLPEVFPGWEIAVIAYFNSLGVEALYEYDYGDGWLHTVKLEGYMFKEKGIKYPICIDGKNACPPEDCGGVDGYYNVIEVLSNPGHHDYEDMRTWAGKDWDPKRFDPEKVRFDNSHKRWQYAFLNRK